MIELAAVLDRHWPEYEQEFGEAILPSHRQAVRCIRACRTRAMEGTLYYCPQCQEARYLYHSCHHRACGKCGRADAHHWLERQKLKLLPVPYYLITFTVPEALRPWLRAHQEPGYGLLLSQSAATLQDIAATPKYLGAELGFVSVLHTWGRQLQFHPHVHCVVPAGGLSADRLRWVAPDSEKFFLPQQVLAARFRNRLRDAIRQAQPQEFAQIPALVWSQRWVVDVQPAGSGQPALGYLAAYVYRTALGSNRILEDKDGQITFEYKDSRDRSWRTLPLPAKEFIRRFLQHVLPKGFVRVRHYGWLSGAATVKWQRLCSLLDWEPPPLPPPPAWAAPQCPRCGSPLRQPNLQEVLQLLQGNRLPRPP